MSNLFEIAARISEQSSKVALLASKHGVCAGPVTRGIVRDLLQVAESLNECVAALQPPTEGASRETAMAA